MKTILLLHDEATRPTQLLRKACLPRSQSAKAKLSPAATATAGDIRVQAVSSDCSIGTGASDFNAHEEMR